MILINNCIFDMNFTKASLLAIPTVRVFWSRLIILTGHQETSRDVNMTFFYLYHLKYPTLIKDIV